MHGPGDVRVEERPEPSPGPGEVLVAMEWGGICGNDISWADRRTGGLRFLVVPLGMR